MMTIPKRRKMEGDGRRRWKEEEEEEEEEVMEEKTIKPVNIGRVRSNGKQHRHIATKNEQNMRREAPTEGKKT